MDRKKWLVVIAVDLAMALAALDSTVIGTAMPTVVASLGGLSLFSWVFSIYLLTSTVALPIFGRLSDLFGRRNMFVVAVWIFTGASALCGLATNMVFLIAARALQGIGAGGVFALSQAVFGEIFPPHERGKMQGYLAAVWGISALVGPLIGGFIVQYLGWRWTFFVNVPVGIAANYMLVVGLTGLASEGTHRRIDYAGAACLVVSIVALMLALLEFGNVGQRARGGAIAGLAVCLVFTAAFLAIESRVPEPILPLGLFGSRTFVTTTVCLFLSGLAMFGAISFIPLFVQGVLGGTAVQAGSVLTPISLSWVTGSTLGGRLLNRLGYRTLAIAGMIGLTSGYLLFTRLGTGSPLSHAAGSGVFLGLGMGVVTVTTVVAVQTAAPPDQIGVVSTLPFFFRNIGATIGVAIMGAILNAHMTGAGTGPLALTAGEGAFQTMPLLLRGHLAAGIRASFIFGLVVVVLGVPVSFLVPDLSPARPGKEAGTRKASSTAPIE
ncbi:MAG: MFS transporter [candidate division NC10 bacterium]|nr:MFS transporter [candidate division NC10 bacterium]MBI4839818.1 MFS transporter [candidate division NC10 bacterium]